MPITMTEIAEQVATDIDIVDRAALDIVDDLIAQIEKVDEKTIDRDDLTDDDALFIGQALIGGHIDAVCDRTMEVLEQRLDESVRYFGDDSLQEAMACAVIALDNAAPIGQVARLVGVDRDELVAAYDRVAYR